MNHGYKKEKKVKRVFSLLLVLCMAFDFSSGSLAAEADEPALALESDGIVEDIALTIAKGFVSGAASKLGEVAMDNLLSVFGYQSPQEKFFAQATESLEEMQSEITGSFNRFQQELRQIENQIADLRNYVTTTERELLAEIDRTSFDTRMTTINQFIARVDTLYEAYLRYAGESDYATAQAMAKQLISDIEKADMPSIMRYLHTEFATGTAGAQRSLLLIYKDYLKKAYTWTNQVAPDLNALAEYCETEMLRAGQLYLEYCNYQQAAHDGESGQQGLWNSNAQAALDDLISAMEDIEDMKLDADYYTMKNGSVYHLINEDYNVDFYFDSRQVDASYTYSYDYNTGAYLWYDYTEIGTVPLSQFRNLEKMRGDYAPNRGIIEWLQDETGATLYTHVFGCVPTQEDNGPLVYLPTLSQASYWAWDDGHVITTWTADAPLSDANDLPGTEPANDGPVNPLSVKFSSDWRTVLINGDTSSLYARVALMLEYNDNGETGLYLTQGEVNEYGVVSIPDFYVPGIRVTGINVSLVPTVGDITSSAPDVLTSTHKIL